MTYIAQLFKKIDKEKMSEQEIMHRQNERIFVFIVTLSIMVMIIDYVLVCIFINMIKNM